MLVGRCSIRCVGCIELFLSLQMFFSVIRPPVLANWHPSMLGSYPPTQTERWACYLFWYVTCQRSGSHVIEKDITGFSDWLEDFNRLYICPKGAEKEFIITGLFVCLFYINALRKGRSGA